MVKVTYDITAGKVIGTWNVWFKVAELRDECTHLFRDRLRIWKGFSGLYSG